MLDGGAEFLVGQTADGRLDLRDCFVCTPGRCRGGGVMCVWKGGVRGGSGRSLEHGPKGRAPSLCAMPCCRGPCFTTTHGTHACMHGRHLPLYCTVCAACMYRAGVEGYFKPAVEGRIPSRPALYQIVPWVEHCPGDIFKYKDEIHIVSATSAASAAPCMHACVRAHVPCMYAWQGVWVGVLRV